ncbi:MAG: ThiF family adenylyltransferase [Pirellulales bacterium]
MNAPRIVVTQSETRTRHEDRFHRFGLIAWWDQSRLSNSKAMVVGAGALGNELVKNLALLGWGRILVADLDRIEDSNLSRSVLYREQDNGAFKSEIAARAAKDIYPQIRSHCFVGNVIHDLGLGVFRWADIVLGGLDNREARLAINRSCWKFGRPWIDGAIEQIQGCARVFVPDGPCYECTMSEADWKLLERRRSCNLLSRREMESGKTPTTPTISSIIAGVQCQEAVKLMHGIPVMSGQGWMFHGLSGDSYQIEYQRDPDCYSHDPFDEVVELDWQSSTTTLRMALDEARKQLGCDAQIELSREVVAGFTCPKCGGEEFVFRSLSQVRAEEAICPRCQDMNRQVRTFYQLRGTEDFLDRTLSEVGLPPYDVLTARAGDQSIGLELTADAPSVLGPLLEKGSEGASP